MNRIWQNSKNKFFSPCASKAFSLAEVLITIAVVGLVASLTIPALISKFQDEIYLNQFKKAYTVISQAYESAAQDNGTADTWGTDDAAYAIMKPYFRVVRDCPTVNNGCFPNNVIYKGLKGGDCAPGSLKCPFYGWTTAPKLRLADGISILWDGGSPQTIFVDVNGDKGPNQWGYDTFAFKLNVKSGAPCVTAANGAHDPCDRNATSYSWYDGGSCASWILKHSNMDYLHRDILDTEWYK